MKYLIKVDAKSTEYAEKFLFLKTFLVELHVFFFFLNFILIYSSKEHTKGQVIFRAGELELRQG